MSGPARRRILIDLRVLPADGSSGAGIAHATRELFEEMGRRASHFSVDLLGAATMGAEVALSAEVIRLASGSAWALREAVRRVGAHVAFIPSGAVPPGLTVPAFPWVHDVAIFSHPEWFPQGAWRRAWTTRWFLRGVRRAPHVFAVSEDTKRDLCALANLSDDRVTVTGQGCRVEVVPHPEEPPYALAIGTWEPRKNLDFLQALWPEVRARVPRARLVLLGRPGWGIEKVVGEGIELVAAPDDAMRDQWLAGATMLLQPSRHEGFGRPVVEAMAAGVPVCASDRGALPEVLGDGGSVQPLVADVWITQIVRFFTDPFARQHAIAAGRSRSKTFSWSVTADRVLAKLSMDW